MADSDRRWHSRHFLRIQGRLIYSTFQDPVVIVDISAGGIGLESNQSLAPGIRVAIEVGRPDREKFIVMGKVAWCVQGQAGGLDVYRMGLEADAIRSLEHTAVDEEEKFEILSRIVDLYASQSSSQ